MYQVRTAFDGGYMNLIEYIGKQFGKPTGLVVALVFGVQIYQKICFSKVKRFTGKGIRISEMYLCISMNVLLVLSRILNENGKERIINEIKKHTNRCKRH